MKASAPHPSTRCTSWHFITFNPIFQLQLPEDIREITQTLKTYRTPWCLNTYMEDRREGPTSQKGHAQNLRWWNMDISIHSHKNIQTLKTKAMDGTHQNLYSIQLDGWDSVISAFLQLDEQYHLVHFCSYQHLNHQHTSTCTPQMGCPHLGCEDLNLFNESLTHPKKCGSQYSSPLEYIHQTLQGLQPRTYKVKLVPTSHCTHSRVANCKMSKWRHPAIGIPTYMMGHAHYPHPFQTENL